MNFTELNITKRYIKKNLKKRFIKLSNILFISSILLIWNLNEELWFCVNY